MSMLYHPPVDIQTWYTATLPHIESERDKALSRLQGSAHRAYPLIRTLRLWNSVWQVPWLN